MYNNKKTQICYDPTGKGDNYGIQFHGDITSLLKYILILGSRGETIPTPSHHGLTINLVNFPYKLVLFYNNWTHDNKGVGRTTLNIALYQEKYEYRINEHGNVEHKQYGISVGEKTGFKNLLKKVGFEVMESWNDSNASTSVTVKTSLEVNMVQADGNKDIEFIDVATEFYSKLTELSNIHNELNTIHN